MTTQKTNYTKQLTISAVLLASGITLNVMLPDLANLKMGLGGPFIYFVGILFGPVFGGLAGALSDILGHFLRPMGAFNPAFTAVAFCKGVSIALLYRLIRKTKVTSYHKISIAIFAAIILWSTLSLGMVQLFPGNAYSLFVSGLKLEVFKGAKINIPFVLFIVGLVGLIVQIFARLVFARKNRAQFEKYAGLLPVVGIPCLVFTTVNTFLIISFYSVKSTFWVFYTPRLAEELLQILYSTYLLTILLHTYETKISKSNR